MKPLKFYKSDRATAGQKKAARRALERRRKMHITKGDLVLVISGDDKGKRGKVLKAMPAEGRGHRGHQHREAPPQGAAAG